MDTEKIRKWKKSLNLDNGLKALSDIKVLIEKFYEEGYIGDWSILELIEDIETICIETRSIHNTLNPYVVRIEKLIKKYYEDIGRSEESYSVGYKKPDRKELIENIMEIIEQAKVPSNYIAISRLK